MVSGTWKWSITIVFQISAEHFEILPFSKGLDRVPRHQPCHHRTHKGKKKSREDFQAATIHRLELELCEIAPVSTDFGDFGSGIDA